MGQFERKQHTLPRRNYAIHDVANKPVSPSDPSKVGKKDREASESSNLLKNIAQGLLALFLLTIIIGGPVWFIKNHHSNPIPSDIRKSVSFSLYYPTKEPEGYTLDDSSIKNSNDTVMFHLVDKSKNRSIIVTQQAVPKNFEPKTLFGHNPLPTTISPLGTVYDLSYKNQSRYMVHAHNSLIFIGSDTKISNAQLQQIINGLKNSK